jgi:predicted dehydrogenase
MMRVLLSAVLAAISWVAAAQEPIQVAVITHAGGAHLGIYFRSLAAIPNVGSVVLADPDGASEADARTALGAKLARVYADVPALFAAEKPVMALVSMEAVLAPAAIDAALDAGCHVLAEKPACVNAEDFAKLAAKANEKHLHLMLALANRVNPEVREAKRLIAEGALGKLYGVELHLIEDQTRLTSPGYHASWFADKARAGGGHLTWLGIHWLDLAMYITGSRIDDVTGFAGNVGGQPITIEDSVAMAMRFDNGVFGTMTSGYYLDSGSTSHVKIWGSKGWLQIDSAEPQTMQVYSTAGGSPSTTEFRRPDGFEPYVAFVGEAVRASMGKSEPPITADESLHVLRCVFGLYDAAAERSTRAVK